MILFVGGVLAASAGATPVNLFGDPLSATGFGWDVSGLRGVAALPDQMTFLTTPGVDISITTPPAIPGFNNPSGSFASPSTGSSQWTITANDRAYSDWWLVIVGHAVSSDPHGPNGDMFYASENVGLEIDDVDPNLRRVSPTQDTGLTYLAIFLGDLAQGGIAALPIEYRIAQGLFEPQSNEFLFPLYQVGYLEGIVPEPSIVVLGLVGGLGLAKRARRHVRACTVASSA